MSLTLSRAEHLPSVVRDELEQVLTVANAQLEKEHDASGLHTGYTGTLTVVVSVGPTVTKTITLVRGIVTAVS